MNRLFVSDMDGCLLDDDKNLPKDFKETLELIHAHNDYFASASGRAYLSLLGVFKGYEDSIIFISENGGNMMYQSNNLYFDALDKSIIKEIVEETYKYPDCIPVLDGKESCYIQGFNKLNDKQKIEFLRYYDNYNDVDDLTKVDAPIDKITLLYLDDIEKNIYPHFKKFQIKVEVSVSGYIWIDIYNKTTSKGKAVGIIQNKFNIKKEDTYVFGDYLNDMSLADFTKNSYAPINAHPSIKERFNYEIGSNNEGSVTKTIKEIIKNNDK